MLHVVTWYWGSKYGPEYVHRLIQGVQANLKQEHVFHLVTEGDQAIKVDVRRHPITDISLLYVPGCFARLRMFDPGWQKFAGISPGDRVVSMDIDAIVVGELDPLFGGFEGGLRIMQGYNTSNPCPFNGSMWMFLAGENPDVWSGFTVERYKALGVPFHEFPDDQGWLHHKFPEAEEWRPRHGVYAFKKVGWPKGDDLPSGARFVAFPGWRRPDAPEFAKIGWIKKYWSGLPVQKETAA